MIENGVFLCQSERKELVQVNFVERLVFANSLADAPCPRANQLEPRLALCHDALDKHPR